MMIRRSKPQSHHPWCAALASIRSAKPQSRHSSRAALTRVPAGVRGVTLVELIISIVVISVAVAGILLVIWRNTQASADPMVWHQAVAVGEAYLEEILTKDFNHAVEAGENRATYDDVLDYNNLANNGCLTTTAACPTLGSCACDQNGNPIDGLQGYNVSVQVTNQALNGISSSNALFVQVTVTPPVGGSITISGYRTNY